MADTRNADLSFGAGDVIAYVAPLGTPAPAAFADLTTPWVCLGWIETTGYIFKLAQSLKEVTAAGTLDPIRTIISAATKTFQATFLEAQNPAVRALYDDVPMTALLPDPTPTPPLTASQVIYTMPEIPEDNRYAFVYDTFDGDKRVRNFAPNGKVTDRGDDQAQQGDVTMLQMTTTLYPAMIGSVRAALQKYIDYGAADLAAFTAGGGDVPPGG